MLVTHQKLRKLERYKIAQLFHEAVRDLRERWEVAEQIARRHGVSIDQVLVAAEEFKPEAHWRL